MAKQASAAAERRRKPARAFKPAPKTPRLAGGKAPKPAPARGRAKPAGRARSAPAEPALKITVNFPGYQAALKHLSERVDVERTRVRTIDAESAFRLDRMRALARRLGDPHKEIRTVHVAGTKGKGSSCHLTAAALRACGYTVGLYTSPHLVDVRERIMIDGRMISHADFTKGMARVASAAEAVQKRHGAPTFFEMMTALAFGHFADQAVDIAIIEVGLGGRLDATNIITPEVCAITAIGKDHTQLLGDTLALIAREKAGIFKPGVPALTLPQKAEPLAALRAEAQRVGAPLRVLGEEIEFSYRFEATPRVGHHTCVCLSTARSNFEHLTVPLAGEHQALNCGLALAILDTLRDKGFDTPETKVIDGLAGLRIPGRMEMVWERPRILLDGAHNADSLAALMRSIGAHVPYDSMVVIFGCAEDKDLDELLRQVALGADKLIVTRTARNARAADPHDLQRRFAEVSGKMCQVAEDLPRALEIASRAVGPEDLICVTGSFYLVGEAKKHLEGRSARLFPTRA